MSDTRRRISEFLPEVIQTDVIKKFFAATADHLFQPDRVEYLSAYIGQKPLWYDPKSDQYVSEETKNRRDYQVDPITVSRLSSNQNISHALFYDDLINKLRFQGALVDDHNRLFEAQYYSWGLPVDIDKLINYQNYVWLSAGPAVITLLDQTDLNAIQQSVSYTYTGHYQKSFSNDVIDGSVEPLVFSTGLKLRFSLDIDVSKRGIEYIIEGVGRQIRAVADSFQSFLAWENPIEWDSSVWDSNVIFSVPNYVLIGRGSENQNPWSYGNRWFHKDLLAFTNTPVTSINQISAARPILEFDSTIRLWNFAERSRGFVNVIDNVTTNLQNVVGASSYVVDGVPLDDNMTVLFTNLRKADNPGQLDPEINNRIYSVTNLRNANSIVLQLLPNDGDVTGAPKNGDGVWILQGDTDPATGLSKADTCWYYQSPRWIQGQSRQLPEVNSPNYRTVLNQAPLFELFDLDGNSLADPAVWPSSSFAGCTLVNYATDPHGDVDPELGFAPITENLSARNFVFDVTLVQQNWQYADRNLRVSIPGFKFWQAVDPVSHTPQYLNNWYSSEILSRQYVVNQHVSKDQQQIFAIDQMPLLAAPLPAAITVTVGTAHKILGQDYTIENKSIKFKEPLAAEEFVEIRTWAGLHNTAKEGFFAIPSNLAANPNNENIGRFSMADVQNHLISIIADQDQISGNPRGANNYRDTAQDQSRGTEILQHRAPMLKLMGLNAVNQTDVFETAGSILDPFNAIQWAQSEYLRFYNKVVNSLLVIYNGGGLSAADSVTEWLQAALNRVNVGKTQASTWANSGFDLTNGAYCSQQSVQPTWVPPSATRLGAAPAYQPVAFFDTTQPINPVSGQYPLSLRCHNGALLVLKDFDNENLGTIANGQTSTIDPQQLTHPVARAWMLFEVRMYQSLPLQYGNAEAVPAVDSRTVFSGKWRQTSYTVDDRLRIQNPAWQKWLTFNQIDAFRNTSFDRNNPFTWNYGNCVDRDQQPVPGHYRGIYFLYYDTDTPDQTPWQMVGFSQKPSWWDSEYGTAPYTNGNLHMWEDLAEGRVAQGPRAGVYSEWARPGLLSYIPVNSVGELLPPYLAGIVTSLPSEFEALADWKFGDRGPIENVWLTTADSDFLWAQWTYLTRPAQFVEYLWDGTRQTQKFADQRYSQWIYTDTGTRKSSSQFYVHRENPQDVVSLTSDLTYYGSCGIQHWISESLINDSRNVTTFFGNVIRGLESNLGHRMGGFTDGKNSRLLVDSFGFSSNDSLLLPQEDVDTILLRSASTGEYFYSGVIVEYRGGQGWRVIGYDSVNPMFEIIPSDTRGPKNSVMVENQTVIEYRSGLPTTTTVPYGTVFATRQEVYDFLICLGRAQQAQGWIFDQYDSTSGRPRNWSLSAREFLFWSQGPWAAGTYISLSPLATLTKFRSATGIIQNVGGIVNGAYSILDKNGVTINLSQIDFLRMDDEISVKPLGEQGIFGLRLYTTTLEHAFVFNNQTIFNDTVYDPLLNQRQSRFKLYGFRTLDWNGRMEAPGYMITQSVSTINNVLSVSNQIIPNFEKSANDLRKLFEIDLATPYTSSDAPMDVQISTISQSVSNNLSRLAKHNIGYQSRAYLTDLLVDDNIAFQFYQGMIAQKGTPISIDKLLRNTNVVKADQEFYYFEEFAFRSGIYGYDNGINSVDLLLLNKDVMSNPQLVEILSNQYVDSDRDDKITYTAGDSRIITSSKELGPFLMRTSYAPQPEDLPLAGYVLLEEADYTVANRDQLLSLYSQQFETFVADPTKPTLQPNDVVWQFIDQLRSWNIYRVKAVPVSIVSVAPGTFDIQTTTITTDQPHGLVIGDLVIIYGVVNAGVNINNTFEVQQVNSDTTFDIELNVNGVGTNGTLWKYCSIRFSNPQERNSAAIPGGWLQGETAYVDGTSSEPNAVYFYAGQDWRIKRTSSLKTDPLGARASRLYNLETGSTISNLTLWDPAKNKIPGIVDREIAFKTPYDPARYTNDPSGLVGTTPGDAWGNDQVGLVWWDLSTTRFLDYEIGTDSYRRQHWGSIAPGTSIDIYEWVRSTVPPASWQTLVANGTNLSAIGSTNTPTGQVKSVFQPYVVRNQQNSAGELQPVYYFWVRNTTTVPDVSWRNIATGVISAVLTQPQNYNIAWWSPIAPRTALIGNIGNLMASNTTVWQLNWARDPEFDNQHKEYTLTRPNDPRSSPDSQLWNKMRQSLVEFDNRGNSVPDLRLRTGDKYGIEIEPRQTMFENAGDARTALVKLVNSLLANSSQPPATDAGRNQYRANFFLSSEPEPASKLILDPVRLATTANLVSYYSPGTSVNQAQLISQTAEALIVDGVAAAINDRILVKDQTEASQNGIYLVTSAGAIPVNTNIVGSEVSVDNQLLLNGLSPEQLIINGNPVNNGQRLLLLGQTTTTQNGLWVVLEAGDLSTNWQLAQLANATDAGEDPLSTSWILQRDAVTAEGRFSLHDAEVHVTDGATQAVSTWHQTNPDILIVGRDPITWELGPAPTIWDRRVLNLGQLHELDYMLNNGSHVLVAAGSETNSRWTIWQWNLDLSGLGTWILTRVQSWVTPLYWSEIDWYADGYDSLSIPDITFDTLAERNSSLELQEGDLVKVLNTGNGEWALYVYDSSLSPSKDQQFTLVGQQNGTIELSDALYDYEKYLMGFDGGGFAADYQGYEYDSRQELNKIVEGLWVGARGTSGLLLIDDTVNEPNQVFFAMINQVLSEQTFVDWLFKTSFINLRGFAENLLPTPYYTTNKINSMIEYVNETKPYHAKIRQFVDWRKATDNYQSASSDFDKPPYVDPVRGVRILDPLNSLDQTILSTNKSYQDWYNNYQINPQLVRTTRTRMLFDRVGCAGLWWYQEGWTSSSPVVDQVVSTLVEWMDIVLNQDLPQDTVVEVRVSTPTILVRNSSNTGGLADWNQVQPGLAFSGTIDLVIRDINQAFDILDAVVPVGYTVLIDIINLTTSNRYIRNSLNTNSLADWTLGAYQHVMGAVDRIDSDYSPTDGMIPRDSPLLISGCASKLTGLDGIDFNTEDSWDQTFWDNVRGWDYSDTAFDTFDQNVSGGMPTNYLVYKGTGSRKQFGLPKASQDPNNLKVWVNGQLTRTPGDWFVANFVSQALPSNGGLGYTFNDEIELVGGMYFPPIERLNSEFTVQTVNGLGAVLTVSIDNGGQGYSIGDQLLISGASPTADAVFSVSGVDNVGKITGVTIVDGGSGYVASDIVNHVWATGSTPLTASPARFRVSGIDFIGRITAVTLIDPGRYMMVPASNTVSVTGGTGINATLNVLWGGRILEFQVAPSEPTAPRPNVWIVENGSTFSPAVSSVLDAAFDGARLNRPDLEGDHPEELDKIWPRHTIYYDVYTSPSAGWGNVVSQTYQGDGITDQFDIGQDITFDGQVSVYVNGLLQTWGTTNDYVINYEYMRVVFANGAPSGQVSVTSVGFGGAGKSMGNWQISSGGQDYNLFDTVIMQGGYPVIQTQVQITAVKAASVSIVDGGRDFAVGDRLLFKYGLGSQTLIVQVSSVAASGTTKGIITGIDIILPGYYTNLTSGLNEWYTDGVGTGFDLVPSWAAANLFLIDRGVYYQEPGFLTQQTVIPPGVLPATGSGLVLAVGPGIIREQIKLLGNGTTDGVILTAPTNQNQLLVTWNGAIFTNYGFDSVDTRVLIFNVVPQVGDVIYVTVYNSDLYSLNRTETFTVTLPTLSYTLTDPPGILPAPTKNVLVYSNGAKLKSPCFYQATGDGVTVTFDTNVVANLGFSPTSAADVTIWADLNIVPAVDYTINSPGAGEITFLVAPTSGTQLIVQIADSTVQNYDYLINGNDLELASWAVSGGETVTAVTFAEDSPTSLVSDQFDGVSPAVYTLSQTPSTYGSVQVWVNGSLLEQTWDYVIGKSGANTVITFGTAHSHVGTDLVEIVYNTLLPAKPAVAMRMFNNIYDDVAWLRLSDFMSTTLAQPVNWNSEYITVVDGTRVPDCSDQSPGVIWIGAERVEYRSKILDATPGYPNQTKLGGLNRGSMGTPGGVNNRFVSENYSGNAQAAYFPTSFTTPYVYVNNLLKIEDVDYQMVLNPPSLSPGLYVQFFSDAIPPLGNANVLFVQTVSSLATTNVSHPANTVVRDASANQFLPAGYIWPYGNQGIQYSNEPQTPFLLAQPGRRIE